VVGVHVQVAAAAHVQVEAAVGREGGEHVIEEADAGRDPGAALAVQIEGEADVGLASSCVYGRSLDIMPSRIASPPSACRSAARKASFSGSEPTLTRRQRERRG
jgi:hypothetical protein